MRTLPKPLPDELWYSALARATYRYGYWSPKGFLDALFSSRTVLAVPDLPCNLDLLASSTQQSWGLTATDIAMKHTLLGYYGQYRSRQERNRLLKAVSRGGSAHLQVRLGICAGAARAPKRFHLCPSCHAADLKERREAYWHRAHHLPGVLVCHVHGDLLVETDIPFRPAGRHEFVAAPLVFPSSAHPIAPVPAKLEVAVAVARRSFELLNAPWEHDFSNTDYRARLGQLGHHASRGAAAQLQVSFVQYFGEDLLARAFRQHNSTAWLAETLRAPRRPLHPLKHVLMEEFLAGGRSLDSGDSRPALSKTWGIYRDEAMRQEAAALASLGLRTHAVAQALEVDWKTANRLLQPVPAEAKQHDAVPDRSAWMALASANPKLTKKELRALAPALYARLYRNDRDWLVAWRAAASGRAKPATRVDWAERDVRTVRLIREAAATIREAVPLQRASHAHILGVLGIRALMTHRASLLSKSCAALAEVCESVEDFQVRRVAAVLAQSAGASPSRWQVLREAGVQPYRFDDRGQELIRRAFDRLSACGTHTPALETVNGR